MRKLGYQQHHRARRVMTRCCLALLLGVGLAGCSLLPDAHKIDVQQGNIVDRAALDELRTGMTKQQVRFLLGNPVINDLFHPDRWDYIYYVTPAGEPPTLKRLTLFFDGSVLTRVQDDYFDQAEDS